MVQRQVHPIDPLDLEDYGLVLVTLQAIDTIAQGDTVFVNASGRIQRAQANASATMEAIGVAHRAMASGNIGRVVMGGGPFFAANYNASGFIGLDAFVSSATAGAIATVAPGASGSIAQVIGRWISGSGLLVQPAKGRQRNELAGSV